MRSKTASAPAAEQFFPGTEAIADTDTADSERLCSGSVILRVPDQAQLVFPDMAARHATPQFLEHFRLRTDRAVQRGTYHLIKISQQIEVL